MLGMVVALMLAGADPVAVAGGAAPAAAPPPAAAPKPAKSDKICWDETPLGTRFSQRVCATRQELDDRRRLDQDMITRRQYNPTQGLPHG